MNECTHSIPDIWLAAYYDGELDQARRQQLEAHLPGCTSCQRKLDALKSLNIALAADKLTESAFTSKSAFWNEIESRLPERAPVTRAPIRWLPGIGLLVINGLVQFGAAAGVVIMFVAGQFGWTASPAVAWSNRALDGWALGWASWVLPAQLSGLGLVLFYIVISAWLAVLYLAWLGFEWRYHQRSVAFRIA